MTTLSTHDTKRSEDVRARLAVLAEMPRRVGRPRCAAGPRGAPAARPSLELLAWQNLVGAWPITGRAAARLPGQGGQGGQARHQPRRPGAGGRRRRSRPGRRRCSADAELVAEIEEFVARIAAPGWSNSLGQKLLQLAGPGRARRLPGHRAVRALAGRPGQPPAGRLRRRAASCWPGSTTAGCRTSTTTGAAKLLVTASALRLRRYRPEAVHRLPPAARRRPGRRRTRWRSQRVGALVAVATRLPVGLAARGGWRRHGAPAARRGRRLDRRAHRRAGRRRRAPAGRAARPATRWRCWCGAGDDRADFAVWAPHRERVRVLVDGTAHAMTRDDARLVARRRRGRGPGTDYAFLLDDDETPLPDPRSRWQPTGVHGRVAASTTTTPSPGPTARGPAGSCPGSVLYELHIGTFTPAARSTRRSSGSTTWSSSASTSSRCCRSTPSTARANWGYDGVGWCAVTENYGGPGRVQAVRRRLPRARARRGARRRLQPPRPVRRLPRPVRPVLRGQHHLGPGAQPRRRRTPTRCAAT